VTRELPRADLEPAVREMVLGSPRLTGFAGGADAVHQMRDAIEDVWLDHDGIRIHCDFHRSPSPRATIVFQPGSGAHARFHFLAGGLLARRGYHVLASETIFALLRHLEPDLAVARNFVLPGKLLSFRLRARWIERHRTRPSPLTELVHGFEKLSADPAISTYLRTRSDPGAAWELNPRSVASMFAFSAPETLVITGSRDRAIPARATRFFTWWSGLPRYEVLVVPDAGHLLFHDHLDVSVPAIADWLDGRLHAARGRAV
jgi:pimeloyl-ACP methyl ester carboxylesterase